MKPFVYFQEILFSSWYILLSSIRQCLFCFYSGMVWMNFFKYDGSMLPAMHTILHHITTYIATQIYLAIIMYQATEICTSELF